MLLCVQVNTLMRALGIAHTKDTPVGDAMLRRVRAPAPLPGSLTIQLCARCALLRRGVSGGERKRVTVGEMLVGPRNVMFLGAHGLPSVLHPAACAALPTMRAGAAACR